MFIAMNRFKIQAGQEQEFIDTWKNRNSYLKDVPGFIDFHLLQGKTEDGITLISSHATWESHEAFEAWTKSEEFKKAHANAGSSREMLKAAPLLELFDVVI